MQFASWFLMVFIILLLLCTLERHSNIIIACPRQELLDWNYFPLLCYITQTEPRRFESDVKIYDRVLWKYHRHWCAELFLWKNWTYRFYFVLEPYFILHCWTIPLDRFTRNSVNTIHICDLYIRYSCTCKLIICSLSIHHNIRIIQENLKL